MSFLKFGLNLQDSVSLVMREFNFFHDIAIYIMMFVSVVVGFLMVFVWSVSFSSSVYLEKKSLEIVWTLLPAMILVFLALPSLKLLFFIEAPNSLSPEATTKVVGRQWYWSFNQLVGEENIDFDSYMVGANDLSEGEFRSLEVDVPLVIRVDGYHRFVATASDVIHSFAVPSLGVKIDAVPGRLNQQFIFPQGVGVFYGQCSEICGANHSYMPVSVEVTR